MKANKKILFGLTAIIIIILATVFSVYAVEGKLIRTTLISQEPDPAEPGKYVDLRFKVENIGDNLIDNVMIKFVDKYPFSLDPGEEDVALIGNLEERQKDTSGAIVKYRVKVDESAVEGENTVVLAYKYSGQGWIEKEFTVDVRTTDIVLSVESVHSNPAVIPPGKESKVTISLKNLADSLIQDVRVKLDLSADTTPFVPINSATEKKIYQIDSMSTKNLVFDVMAEADSDPGAYKIPVDLNYYDEIGTEYSKEDIIGLIIGTVPDLSVGIENSEIYKAGSNGEVTFKFVNKGLIDIKFLNVVLEESDAYEIISPAEVYIGNIDSDDFETVDYQLHINKNNQDIVFPISIEYMDANNNEFKEDREVKLKLYSREDAINVGLEEKPVIGLLIVIIIVIAGLIVFWRLRKRKKNKNKR